MALNDKYFVPPEATQTLLRVRGFGQDDKRSGGLVAPQPDQRLGKVNPLLRSFCSSTGMPAAVLPLLQSSMASTVEKSGLSPPLPPALPV